MAQRNFVGDFLLPPVYRIQLVRENKGDRPLLNGPSEAASVIWKYLEHADREYFVSMMLDSASRVIGINTVSIGTLDCCLVSPREVFKAAILANAASIIVAHNHPSGDVRPSQEDLAVTKSLRKAGTLLEIEVLDHIIVGDGGVYTSLCWHR
ncbi:MAG: JAB domain-containing protein [Armatimonadetes bacterium]|nr:JAB domain-containing protein [Armatimonadota bacterium]